MIIGIDGNEANTKEKVGVHQYAYEILWALHQRNQKQKDKDKFIVYLNKHPRKDLPTQGKYWTYTVLPGGRMWIIKKLMPYLFSKPEINLLFTPSHYLPPFSRMPKVCVIHDLGYLEFSGQFKTYDFWQLKYWSAISLFVSKYIISVSESTRKDIVRHYAFASNKCKVVHHGYDRTRFNSNISKDDVRRVKKKYNLDTYILFLSTLKPSKNIEGILEAYSLLPQNTRPALVIGGKKGWLFESVFKKVKALNLQKEVTFTDFVKEDDKPALIAGAKVFVSPSFWEGFGMHVLESMACGTPVVLSKVASLPEVAGNAGVYVNEKSPRSIAKGIGKVLGMDEKRYNKLVQKGFAQAKNFSWEKAADKTYKVFKETLS